jgi:hypothetical protein
MANVASLPETKNRHPVDELAGARGPSPQSRQRSLRGRRPMTVPLRHDELTALLDRRGRRLQSTIDAIQRRDQLICEIARRFYPGMSDRAAAAIIQTKLARYRSGAWRRDSAELLCPDRHRGIITELLWCLLKTSRDAVPSVETIRKALSRTASSRE